MTMTMMATNTIMRPNHPAGELIPGPVVVRGVVVEPELANVFVSSVADAIDGIRSRHFSLPRFMEADDADQCGWRASSLSLKHVALVASGNVRDSTPFDVLLQSGVGVCTGVQ